MIDPTHVTRAREAANVIVPLAREIERERALPPAALEALVGAGVFKLLVPRAYGGAETNVETLLAVIETIAAADGSAGWCTMIGATSGLMSAFLPDELAREVYAPAGAITGGVFAPLGLGRPVEGGYRVQGRWPFASGCQHSSHVLGGAILPGPEGKPEVRSLLFTASEIRIRDTWDTSGLRGTGSHDFEVDDLFVPEARAFSLFGPPRRDEALYRQPFFGTLAAGVAAVSLGIARGAIDSVIALATVKTPGGAKRTIAHRELVQRDVARADGMVRAARARLFESVGETAEEVASSGSASLASRAQVRIAACHAATESARAVDLAYEAGGGSSIYASSPLQRAFRDVHTATQHVMVSAASATTAGRVLLGVDTDVTTL